MQMAALSRNTASVAQDFHNAGGGSKTLTINTSLTEDDIKQMIINHMKTASNNELSSNEIIRTTIIINNNIDDFAVKTEPNASTSSTSWSSSSSTSSASTAPASAISTISSVNTSMAMSKNVSPPALYPSSKKRRKNSTHEKENENIYVTTTANNIQPINPINYTLSAQHTTSKQGLDNYIRATTGKSSMKFPSGLEILALGNVSPTFPTIDANNLYAQSRSEKRRKQAQPRKCIDLAGAPETATTNSSVSMSDTLLVAEKDYDLKPAFIESYKNAGKFSLNSIREKHLNRMVSKKKSCNICSKGNICMVLPYHGIASLILHKLWRHSQQIYVCGKCGESFNKRYKCKLHKKVRHVKRKIIILNFDKKKQKKNVSSVTQIHTKTT